MPELPEVEVTRRRIEAVLLERRIEVVETTPPSYFFVTPPATLRRRLCGQSVSKLERLGKYLLATLSDGSGLLLHLGMTGQLFSENVASPRLLSATARASLSPEAQASFKIDAHTHLVLRFEDGGPAVLFRDVRKFGKVIWLAPGETHPRLARLGVDALTVTGGSLFRATRRRKVAIKSLLLDQSVLAGVGNIYADEALFWAGVRPGRRCVRVTRAECMRIADGLRRVLERSIETGGSSISDYVAPDGQDGGYQDERRVYARTGQPCFACGAPIKRKVIGQRSAHYCPACQV
ncbi:MAG: bifunctional DNA-formamidopyrimidine glycosylase/DNA-(apurinic or apyrimidinic site) lyase [Myxococcota bacterium]|nr:bifunctional DNA-formamidopyrimidine glycosylase/DNA-(apurinic or apyrimidinic site) lyase [Myxococcota bacterium]